MVVAWELGNIEEIKDSIKERKNSRAKHVGCQSLTECTMGGR